MGPTSGQVVMLHRWASLYPRSMSPLPPQLIKLVQIALHMHHSYKHASPGEQVPVKEGVQNRSGNIRLGGTLTALPGPYNPPRSENKHISVDIHQE